MTDKMTKEQLESYISKVDEIKELQQKLSSLSDGDNMIGHDIINDYRTGYPRPQVVVGFDWNRYTSTRDRMISRCEKLNKECTEIEEWVESIEDSLTRRIFRFRYIDGFSQEKVARAVNYSQWKISTILNNYEIL